MEITSNQICTYAENKDSCQVNFALNCSRIDAIDRLNKFSTNAVILKHLFKK